MKQTVQDKSNLIFVLFSRVKVANLINTIEFNLLFTIVYPLYLKISTLRHNFD